MLGFPLALPHQVERTLFLYSKKKRKEKKNKREKHEHLVQKIQTSLTKLIVKENNNLDKTL